MRRFILFLCMVVICQSSVLYKGHYSRILKWQKKLELAGDLDFEKYKGTWYLLEYGLSDDPEDLSCVQETYSKNVNNRYLGDVSWSGKVDGKLKEVEGIIALPDKDFISQVLPNLYLDGAQAQLIIDRIDYSAWSVEYIFGYDSRGQIFDRAVIKSRTPTLDPLVLKTLRTFVKNIFDDVKFRKVNQTNCDRGMGNEIGSFEEEVVLLQ